MDDDWPCSGGGSCEPMVAGSRATDVVTSLAGSAPRPARRAHGGGVRAGEEQSAA